VKAFIAAIGLAAVGFALPANFEIDVCAKGTLIDSNTGEVVCVGPIVERNRVVNLEELMQVCLERNANWHGIAEVRPGKTVCW
jgi:hypothetical protein